MQLDEIHQIDDLTPAALLVLVQRIERSRTPEQLIYREAELDEVWRLLGNHAGAHPEMAPERLAELKAAVMAAHDLVGVDENPKAAAERLRAVLG